MGYFDKDYLLMNENGNKSGYYSFFFNGESSKKRKSTRYLEHTSQENVKLHLIDNSNYNYPEQFKTFQGITSPEVLYCLGDLSLFRRHIIMIGGSRNASNRAQELAYKCGRLIAEQGFTVASGYARGVDMAAHLGALEAGGDTIAILPYGLFKFKLNHAIREVFDLERVLVVSELPPSSRFTVRSALSRNKLLVALSRAVIVIEPSKTGGTWFSARYAGKMGKPLYFLEGKRKYMISKLESIGGKRLQVKNGAPELSKICEDAGKGE